MINWSLIFVYGDSIFLLLLLLFFFNKLWYILKTIYLFIYLFYGCIGSLFLWAGLLQLQQVVATLWLQCTGFSLQWFLLLWGTGSRCMQASVVAVHGLSSCGTWAQLFHGVWDLPKPGIKLVSPALVGGFSTTEPPWKPPSFPC